MALCSCTTGVKNFGQPGCVGVLERMMKGAFVYRMANDGTVNKILSTDTINDSYVSGKINQTDKSKRWFILPTLNQVKDERADNNTFEIDGFNVSTSKGVRTLSFTVFEGASPELADAFESWGCIDSAFYPFSVTDQIGGNGSVSGELRPFRIKKGTMKVKYNPPTKNPEAPAMIMVSFDYSDLEDDGDIAYIDYGTGANNVQVPITEYTGLIDTVMNAATSITTTGFVVDIDLIYGSEFSKAPFTGGLLANFSLNEVSPTPGSISITSVTEGTGSNVGKYTFVIPAQTSGDVLRLSFSKNGYEAAGTIDITIP